METISFNKKSLNEFVRSEQFSKLENIPINMFRAISQINNPRADDNDILLVAQFDENKTVGYLGVLPDFIFTGEDKVKMGWLTCFWVHEDYKSHDVAANLFRRVIRAWEQKIFITNIVPWLEPVYQKTKLFKPTQFKEGFRGYIRFNFSEILPPKKILFKRLTFLFKLIDGCLNLFADRRFLFFKRYPIDSFKVEYLINFNEIPEDFLNDRNQAYWNRRAKEEINWIIKYPWVIEGAKEDFHSARYYFTSMSKRFFHQVVKFTDKSDQITGIIFLRVRDNNLTIPYVFCKQENYDLIGRFLVNTMVYLKLNMITTFQQDLAESLHKLRIPFIFRKKITRPYFISKKFDTVKELNFQDGDGDGAFY